MPVAVRPAVANIVDGATAYNRQKPEGGRCGRFGVVRAITDDHGYTDSYKFTTELWCGIPLESDKIENRLHALKARPYAFFTPRICDLRRSLRFYSAKLRPVTKLGD